MSFIRGSTVAKVYVLKCFIRGSTVCNVAKVYVLKCGAVEVLFVLSILKSCVARY